MAQRVEHSGWRRGSRWRPPDVGEIGNPPDSPIWPAGFHAFDDLEDDPESDDVTARASG